jgi:predicted dehydrogenase
MKNRRNFIKETALAGIGITTFIPGANIHASSEMNKDLKIGIIGLDTSHSPAFTKYINDPEKDSMKGAKVTAAYPHGSSKIESSYSRIPRYTEELKSMGVIIVDDINDLINSVDAVLLETNDGTLHLEQALQVIKAKKPVFVDKPVAAGLKDVIKIYDAASKNQVPLFSSSSLRYIQGAQDLRHNKTIGDILGAYTYGTVDIEPSHTDLYWYGIHGVELLYTLMKTGCQKVSRISTESTELVIGKWSDERIGSFRGILKGRKKYGGTVFGSKDVTNVGTSEGYGMLIEKIIDFFRTGTAPVNPDETIELYTFMEAADVSKQRKGDWVDLKEVYEMALD